MAQELKAYTHIDFRLHDLVNMQFYLTADVDALIAEKDAEIQTLKQKLMKYGDTNAFLVKENTDLKLITESKDTEIRRLRRLLWHAIALFCARSCEYFNGIMSHCLMGQDDLYKRCEEKKNKYLHAMYKCRAKAEQYK